MEYKEILIEIIGWFGSILIVGSYALNLRGKLEATSNTYIWSNIIGAVCFATNSFSHGAMPSVAVNIVWIGFAIETLWRNRKAIDKTSS
jgi:fatty acid desaturase